MNTPVLVLSDLTLAAIQAEATRAHLKHGDYSMLGPHYSNTDRLAILGEEVGEAVDEAAAMVLDLLARSTALSGQLGRIAHVLTYDQGGPGVGNADRDALVKELIQICAMGASWIEALEGHHG